MTNKKKILGYPVNVQYSNGLIPTGGVTGGSSQVEPAVITNYNNLLDPEKTSGVKFLSATFDGEGGSGSGTPGVGEGGNGRGTPGVGEGGSGSGTGTPSVGISGLSEGVIDPVVQGAYKQLYEHYDDIYKRNEEAANAQKNQAYATAEQNYQNAVAEAQAGYYKNLVGYGSKAEQLDRMGLGGSGYSDYLTGKAMELQRSETQAAAVERNAAKSAADQLYSQNLLAAESARDKDKLAVLEKQLAEYKQNKIDRNTVIAGILDFASSGNADIDTLKALGKEGGIAADDPIWITVADEIERAAAANNEANLQSFKQWLFAGDKPFIDNYNPANPDDVNKFYARASLFGVDTNSDEFGALAQQLGIAWAQDTDDQQSEGGNKTDDEGGSGETITDDNLQSTGNIAYDDNNNLIQAKYTGVNEQGQYVYEWNGNQIVVNPEENPYTLTKNKDVDNGYFKDKPYQPDNKNGQKLSDTGNFAYVSGVKENIWKTSDGQQWLWNEAKNQYMKYDATKYPPEIHVASNGITRNDLQKVVDRDAYYDVNSNNFEELEKRINAAIEMQVLNTDVNSGGYLYKDKSGTIKVDIGDKAMNDGDDFTLRTDNSSYDLELGLGIRYMWEDDYGVNGHPDAVNEKTKAYFALKDTLDKMVGGSPKQGDSAVVLGDLYVFAGSEWRTTSSRYGSAAAYDSAVRTYINTCNEKSGTSA
jgi:hypothetical protein